MQIIIPVDIDISNRRFTTVRLSRFSLFSGLLLHLLEIEILIIIQPRLVLANSVSTKYCTGGIDNTEDFARTGAFHPWLPRYPVVDDDSVSLRSYSIAMSIPSSTPNSLPREPSLMEEG
jgi:hypothetical protein